MFIEKEKEDPKYPRCKRDRSFLVKKIGQTRDEKQYWQCPKCKQLVAI